MGEELNVTQLPLKWISQSSDATYPTATTYLRTENTSSESTFAEKQYLESYMGQQRIWGLPLTITLTIIYCGIFFSGGIGNICTCIVVIRNRYMHTATNYYLLNLAVSDTFLLMLGEYTNTYRFFLYPGGSNSSGKLFSVHVGTSFLCPNGSSFETRTSNSKEL